MSIGKKRTRLQSVWFTAMILIREARGAVKRPIKIYRGFSPLYIALPWHPQKTTLNVRRVPEGWSYVLSSQYNQPAAYAASVLLQVQARNPGLPTQYFSPLATLLTGGQGRSRVIRRPLWDLCWSCRLQGLRRLGASNGCLFTAQKPFREWSQTEPGTWKLLRVKSAIL